MTCLATLYGISLASARLLSQALRKWCLLCPLKKDMQLISHVDSLVLISAQSKTCSIVEDTDIIPPLPTLARNIS